MKTLKKNKLTRPKSLTNQTADALREGIINGTYDLGQNLSETKIAEDLGVSRTPVRESFALLEHEGLVVSRPQSGTAVFKLDETELEEFCDFRCLLEVRAMELCFNDGTGKLAKAWEKIAAKMQIAFDKNQTERYLALDIEFHNVLFEMSNNRYLINTYRTLSTKIIALRNRLGQSGRHLDKGLGEHLELAKLANKEITPIAVELMRAHTLHRDGSYWKTISAGV
ncbi:MAG: GntR family transcriptional regulator [OCS116 cluster bacterium]|nr:GntR family transcriptional regulator [OCS116 cluster bacterium]